MDGDGWMVGVEVELVVDEWWMGGGWVDGWWGGNAIKSEDWGTGSSTSPPLNLATFGIYTLVSMKVKRILH